MNSVNSTRLLEIVPTGATKLREVAPGTPGRQARVEQLTAQLNNSAESFGCSVVGVVFHAPTNQFKVVRTLPLPGTLGFDEMENLSRLIENFINGRISSGNDNGNGSSNQQGSGIVQQAGSNWPNQSVNTMFSNPNNYNSNLPEMFRTAFAEMESRLNSQLGSEIRQRITVVEAATLKLTNILDNLKSDTQLFDNRLTNVEGRVDEMIRRCEAMERATRLSNERIDQLASMIGARMTTLEQRLTSLDAILTKLASGDDQNRRNQEIVDSILGSPNPATAGERGSSLFRENERLREKEAAASEAFREEQRQKAARSGNTASEQTTHGHPMHHTVHQGGSVSSGDRNLLPSGQHPHRHQQPAGAGTGEPRAPVQ